MRDYKLRKKVFNSFVDGEKLEKKTSAMTSPVGVDEEGKLWASGGGSGSGESPFYHISFDVEENTPYTPSSDTRYMFLGYSLTLKISIGNEGFTYDNAYRTGQNIYFDYIANGGEDVVSFTLNTSNGNFSLVSPVTGTLNMDFYENRNASLHASYSNGKITINEPYFVIEKLVEQNNNGALVVHINEDGNVMAIGYLTIATVSSGGTKTVNISCDININGKFIFTVDANDQIVGTHS